MVVKQATLQEAKLIATTEVATGAVRRFRSFKEEYWLSDNIHESVDPDITIDSDNDGNMLLDSDDD